MNLKKTVASLFTIAAMAAIVPNALAQNLAPNGETVPGATSVITTNLLATTGQVNFTLGAESGKMMENVYDEGVAANPLGGYTFVYQIDNTSTNASVFHELSVQFYGGAQTSVFYDPTYSPLGGFGPGVKAPNDTDRSADGNTVDFFFPHAGSGLTPGQVSDGLVIRTNLTSFGPGTTAVIDGRSFNLTGIGPVPEPSTVAAFAFMGLGMMGLMLRARKSRGSMAS